MRHTNYDVFEEITITIVDDGFSENDGRKVVLGPSNG